MDDHSFLAEFEAAAIPSQRWSHRAHLRMAFLYLRDWPFPDALARIRSGILSLNRANNVQDTPESGYHETVTVAWARIIASTIRAHGPTEDSMRSLRPIPTSSISLCCGSTTPGSASSRPRPESLRRARLGAAAARAGGRSDSAAARYRSGRIDRTFNGRSASESHLPKRVRENSIPKPGGVPETGPSGCQQRTS